MYTLGTTAFVVHKSSDFRKSLKQRKRIQYTKAAIGLQKGWNRLYMYSSIPTRAPPCPGARAWVGGKGRSTAGGAESAGGAGEKDSG